MVRKTKAESAQTRETILDAAEIEMLARGVTHTSLERIAKRADVTRGAIYWHFADKTGLLEAMIQRTALPLRDLRQCMSAHIPLSAPLRLLREMMIHSVNRLAYDQQHRRVIHIVLHRCEITEQGQSTGHILDAMFDDTRDVLFSLCEDIAAQGQLRASTPVLAAADIIMAFMSGLYECSLRHPETYDVAGNLEAKIDALLSGLFHMDAIDQSSTD